jgi:hypothetical protein
MSVQDAVMQYQQVQLLINQLFKDGVHYGTIPGTQKPTLYQAGAQQVRGFFDLYTLFENEKEIEDWTADPPFFYYRVKCKVYRKGVLILNAGGSCNSKETRYRYRWADPFSMGLSLADVQAMRPDDRRMKKYSEFAFAVEEAKTEGEYSKPQAYWNMINAAIDSGKAVKGQRAARSGKKYDAWEFETWSVRIENRDTADLANTILKMAEKRALVAAMLRVGALSETFTQDMEDIAFSDEVFEGSWEEGKPTAPVQGTKTETIAVDEAANMPEAAFAGETLHQPPSVSPVQKSQPDAVLEKAHAHQIKFGKHNGATLLEVEREAPTWLDWVVKNLDRKEGTQYADERASLIRDAQLIIDARGKAEAVEAASTIVELRGQVRLFVKDFWPNTAHDGHVTFVLKRAPFNMTKSFRDLTLDELEACYAELRAMDERRTAATTDAQVAAGEIVGDVGGEREEAPEGFDPADDIPF